MAQTPDRHVGAPGAAGGRAAAVRWLSGASSITGTIGPNTAAGRALDRAPTARDVAARRGGRDGRRVRDSDAGVRHRGRHDEPHRGRPERVCGADPVRRGVRGIQVDPIDVAVIRGARAVVPPRRPWGAGVRRVRDVDRVPGRAGDRGRVPGGLGGQDPGGGGHRHPDAFRARHRRRLAVGRVPGVGDRRRPGLLGAPDNSPTPRGSPSDWLWGPSTARAPSNRSTRCSPPKLLPGSTPHCNQRPLDVDRRPRLRAHLQSGPAARIRRRVAAEHRRGEELDGRLGGRGRRPAGRPGAAAKPLLHPRLRSTHRRDHQPLGTDTPFDYVEERATPTRTSKTSCSTASAARPPRSGSGSTGSTSPKEELSNAPRSRTDDAYAISAYVKGAGTGRTRSSATPGSRSSFGCGCPPWSPTNGSCRWRRRRPGPQEVAKGCPRSRSLRNRGERAAHQLAWGSFGCGDGSCPRCGCPTSARSRSGTTVQSTTTRMRGSPR